MLNSTRIADGNEDIMDSKFRLINILIPVGIIVMIIICILIYIGITSKDEQDQKIMEQSKNVEKKNEVANRCCNGNLGLDDISGEQDRNINSDKIEIIDISFNSGSLPIQPSIQINDDITVFDNEMSESEHSTTISNRITVEGPKVWLNEQIF